MNDTGAKIMKSLIVYFSWTGCVAKLAEHLRTQLVPLGEVVMMRIVPVREHGYWGWLMRSFLPGWSVPIHPVVADFGDYDVVCLGFPKWTLSCPPVNRYIRDIPLHPRSRIGLFMSCGGFDQERYMKSMVNRLALRGARVVAVTSIRRNAISDGRFKKEIDHFCRRLCAHT